MDVLHLLVAGSRGFADEGSLLIGGKLVTCEDVVKTLIEGRSMFHNNAPVSIIEGGARGVDRMAGVIAKDEKWELYEMPADWQLGRQAGYLRNAKMHQWLAQFPLREVLLIWDGESRGTSHNFKLSATYGNPLVCYLYKENRFMSRDEIMALT